MVRHRVVWGAQPAGNLTDRETLVTRLYKAPEGFKGGLGRAANAFVASKVSIYPD